MYVAIKAFCRSAVNMLLSLPPPTIAQYFSECDLHLKRNPIGYDGMLDILTLLCCENCPITCLDLGDTVSDTLNLPTGIVNVADLTQTNHKLTQLELNDNLLSGNSVSVLVKYLRVCQSLEDLNCSECSLTTGDIRIILRQLKLNETSLSNLRDLNVSNCLIDDDGVLLLIDNQSNIFPCLDRVDLDDNPVSEEAESRLRECLKVYKILHA